jgi:hypothetical protein
VYEKEHRTFTPKRLALINWASYNTSVPDTDTKTVTLDISAWIGSHKNKSNVTAKRMTAPGINTKDSDLVTWAGQAYTNGTAVGRERVEKVEDGVVSLRGSEALLVFL